MQFELKINKAQANKPQPVKKMNNLFASAMEDTPVEESKPKLSQHFAEMSKQSYNKMLEDTSNLIVEDPTIFAYDAHYDDYQEKRKEIEQQKRQKSGPKHIQNIQKAVDKRKIEQTMIYEKMEGKKLLKEAENTGGQVYVTKKYKQTMEEGRKFLEEDEAKEKYNASHSGEGQDNMYKNLYKQDIFMGGYRPDLNNMIKQDKTAPQPSEQVAQQPEQPVQNIAKPPQEERPQFREQKGPEARAKGELSPERKEREAPRRAASRSRSRSRSKSPTRLSALREEAKVQKEEPEKEKEKEKEPEKELTKEEKLKLAKERYMQRKMGQAPGPTAEQA